MLLLYGSIEKSGWRISKFLTKEDRFVAAWYASEEYHVAGEYFQLVEANAEDQSSGRARDGSRHASIQGFSSLSRWSPGCGAVSHREPEARDNTGMKALLLASLQSVELGLVALPGKHASFLENGADTSILKNDGNSALNFLMLNDVVNEGKIIAVVKLLLDHGVPLQRTIDGISARMIAEKKGFLHILELLKTYEKRLKPTGFSYLELAEDAGWTGIHPMRTEMSGAVSVRFITQ